MEPDPINILTSDEKGRWAENDMVGYYNWIRRMVAVDCDMIFYNKKTPRHRYNKDPKVP